ncbi:MAG TPA: VWA domain-containing protein [Candidatus Acidoferrales bacterium]|nr:VWA domain-containing protein [Candidatus Acidoferrales bacterium]
MTLPLPCRHWAAPAAVLAAALACAPLASAQEPAGPIHPPPNAAPQAPGNLPDSPSPQPQTSQRPIRVRATEITAPVTARGRDDDLVLNLEQKDFHIFDNGVEQKIDHFDLGGDPLAIALLVETSARVESLLPAVRQSAIVFTQTVMGPTAEAAVLSYDGTVEIKENFTSDDDAIETAIHKLPLGTSSARLYDGISKGVTLLSNQPPRERRILLIIGEAVDSGSESKLGAALREAELANVTIYTIGLSTTAAEFRNAPKQYEPASIGPPGTFPVPLPPGVPETPQNEQTAEGGNMDLLSLAIWVVQHASNTVKNHALEVATAATGGRHISTMKDVSIQKAMDQIGGELHAQYTLSYRPASDAASGFHEIKVTVDRPGVRIRTRPGYYLPPPM